MPVGEALLGRVVDSMGAPLDGGLAIAAERWDPIERPAPAIVDRDLVTQPLMTGLTVIDAMIPLGRGQRELIIGDRKTGKTAVALDTIINQRNTDVICVYAAVGQRVSMVNQVVDAVRQHGAMERCIFVVGEAEAPPGAQWVTPYTACSMAEYFRDQGRDVLLVIEDSDEAVRRMRQWMTEVYDRYEFRVDPIAEDAALGDRQRRLLDDLAQDPIAQLGQRIEFFANGGE